MKEISRKRVHEGYFTVDELMVKTKDGTIVSREVMNRKDGVCALVKDTKTGDFIFVKQYRPGTGDQLLEIPAGTLDIPGEDPKEAMIREIDEEIGYEVDEIELVTKCYMSPGGSTEMLHIYYATVSNQIHQGGGTPNEDIEIIRINEYDLPITNFNDAKTQIAVMNYLYDKTF